MIDLTTIGPVRFRAVCKEGRKFPCWCHREPETWMMIAVRPFGDGKIAYCFVPFPDRALQKFPMDILLENGFLTLMDIQVHPELYREAVALIVGE